MCFRCCCIQGLRPRHQETLPVHYVPPLRWSRSRLTPSSQWVQWKMQASLPTIPIGESSQWSWLDWLSRSRGHAIANHYGLRHGMIWLARGVMCPPESWGQGRQYLRRWMCWCVGKRVDAGQAKTSPSSPLIINAGALSRCMYLFVG